MQLRAANLTATVIVTNGGTSFTAITDIAAGMAYLETALEPVNNADSVHARAKIWALAILKVMQQVISSYGTEASRQNFLDSSTWKLVYSYISKGTTYLAERSITIPAGQIAYCKGYREPTASIYRLTPATLMTQP